MLVIIGHGPSAYNAEGVDEHTVIRCRTDGWDKPGRGIPSPGTRTDITVSRREKYDPTWLVQGELDELCRETLKPFHPRNPKPSTGLCACILARHFYPDEDIRVTGFDWTLNPELASHYPHDAKAENACFLTLGIAEYG